MQQTSSRRAQSLLRQQEALKLRRQGKRYDEIGMALGMSTSGAWHMVQRAYKRTLKFIDDEAAFQRRLDLERLDAALAAIWDKVQDGNLGAIDRLASILNRRARLLGLDAPQKVDVGLGDELAQVLASLAEDDDVPAA